MINEELSQFEQGIQNTVDPSNVLITQGGKAITSLQSPWLFQQCSQCQHSFRLDDEVFIDGQGTVNHDSSSLPCSQQREQEPTPAQSDDLADFFKGIDKIWAPPENLPVHRLAEGHPLLGLPYAGFKRHQCAVCGHTLRLFDVVVICPCNPQEPRCQIAIHRDPSRNLLCWEDWKPKDYQLYCPATSRKL
jgi:hypothetical protein